MEFSIYTPESSAQVFHYHFQQTVGHVAQSWTYYHNTSTFLNATGKRIACFQIPYPYDTDIEDEINQLYDHVDRILIIGSELHPRTVDFIRRFDREKIMWFICGYLNFTLNFSQQYRFMDWFTTSVHFYKNVMPSKLYELEPFKDKPFMFDALLGRKKTHRDLAYKFIQENNLNGITTYINEHHINFDPNIDSANKWIWGNEDLATVENIEQVQWTVDRIRYHDYNISLSQVIPIDIYNQTAYSLVCETNIDNDFVFYTEKTVKPILARRLFVLIGNRFALAGLHRLGFKTFNGIIDESYDAMELTNERHLAALEQLKWLCTQDQTTILNRCQDIVNHNYNLMYGNDWYNLFRQPFARLLIN